MELSETEEASMTKFILHGGETGIENEHNKDFYRAWVSDFKEDLVPNILLVYFSRPLEEWQRLGNSDKERFAKYTGSRKVKFTIADSDLKIFEQQVKDADVVYVRGGSSDMLVFSLGPIKDKFLEIIKGKLFVGSSAGVMFLSHYTQSHTSGQWEEGLGILPINSFVHYSDKFKGEIESLKNNYPEDKNELILLPETEFVVRNF